MEDRMHQHKSMSAAQLRRINKPVMEKKRRARINNCLTQLKSLVLDAMNKDPSRYSKLEKADILEMTVKYLREEQRQQLAVAANTDPTVMTKYKSGFSECSKEISRYLHNIDGLSNDVKARVMNHLENCSQQMTMAPNNPFSMFSSRVPHVQIPPINIQIPNTTPLMSLPGSRMLTPQSPSNLSQIQTLVTPDGNQLQGSFQLLPGPFPGGNGLTVFVPSPTKLDKSISNVTPVSPMSLQSDVSPISSPELEKPRYSSVTEKKTRTHSMTRYVSATRSTPRSPNPVPEDGNVNQRDLHRNSNNAQNDNMIRDINHNEVQVKTESVWRPW